MNWKNLAKKFALAITAIACLGALNKIMTKEDIIYKSYDPTKTRVDRHGNVIIGTDDYTIT